MKKLVVLIVAFVMVLSGCKANTEPKGSSHTSYDKLYEVKVVQLETKEEERDYHKIEITLTNKMDLEVSIASVGVILYSLPHQQNYPAIIEAMAFKKVPTLHQGTTADPRLNLNESARFYAFIPKSVDINSLVEEGFVDLQIKAAAISEKNFPYVIFSTEHVKLGE